MSSTDSRAEWYARTFRESAARAHQSGDRSRATILFEHALNFTIDVLNEVLAQRPRDDIRVRILFEQAIECAEARGRLRKAKHLRKDLSDLLDAL